MNPNAEPFLELEEVTKRYPSPDGVESRPVLAGISLQLTPGESLAVVGPSGSGKSTLLNIMGALDRPTSGRVLLSGRNLATLPDKELATIRNREIGFVFQLHHLLPQCTVLENVLIPRLAGHVDTSPSEGMDRARSLLDRVGLSDRLHYRPAQLSGGERQRVAVVRGLINRPRLLLADEPTGSLDGATAETLGRLLADLNKEEGVALVVVTHALNLASDLGGVYRLHEGKLLSQGESREGEGIME
ncbi:MAG: ABC transporter ATP-binding protein [Planctomycetota bacterium]